MEWERPGNDGNYNHEECAYCKENVHKDEISQYTSWIDGKEVIEWVCDECYARGVFNDMEEEVAVAV